MIGSHCACAIRFTA